MQARTRADKVTEKGDKVENLGGWIGGRRVLKDQEGG